MLNGIDIEAWLAERSNAVRRSEREIVFEHPGGRKSLLLLTAGYKPAVNCPALAEFFERFEGGFIGDGFLLIGTPDEPVASSTGVVIPTIEEIRSISVEQGIVFDEGETPFMTTAYMFVYAFSREGRLRCHDRDFSTVTEDRTLVQVLNDWWTLKEADSS
jgi:hypothetical protein